MIAAGPKLIIWWTDSIQLMVGVMAEWSLDITWLDAHLQPGAPNMLGPVFQMVILCCRKQDLTPESSAEIILLGLSRDSGSVYLC